MGLTILVKKQVQEKATSLKINGYKVTEEDWENMNYPTSDDTIYRIFPERLKEDQALYKKIEEYFNDLEVDDLNIGYGTFDLFRQIILRNCNVKLFAGKAETASDKDREIKEIGLLSPFEPFYYNYDDKSYSKKDLHAIEFLMNHYDCEGDYPNQEIKMLSQLIKKYSLKENCKTFLQKNHRLDQYQEFVNFIHKYAKTNDCYFEFC